MFPEYLLLSGFLQLCLFILNLISPAQLYEFNGINTHFRDEKMEARFSHLPIEIGLLIT